MSLRFVDINASRQLCAPVGYKGGTLGDCFYLILPVLIPRLTGMYRTRAPPNSVSSACTYAVMSLSFILFTTDSYCALVRSVR